MLVSAFSSTLTIFQRQSNYEITYKNVLLLKWVRKHSRFELNAFNINLNYNIFYFNCNATKCPKTLHYVYYLWKMFFYFLSKEYFLKGMPLSQHMHAAICIQTFLNVLSVAFSLTPLHISKSASASLISM